MQKPWQGGRTTIRQMPPAVRVFVTFISISMASASFLPTSLPARAAIFDGSVTPVNAVPSVPVKSVDFSTVRQFQLTSSGLDSLNRERLLRQHAQPRQPEVLHGPDGKVISETREMRYNRLVPYPYIDFETGVEFIVGNGRQPGFLSVSGTRPHFTPDGGRAEQDDILWKWKVPAALRGALVIFPNDRGGHNDDRFRIALAHTASVYCLMLFDALKGPVWQSDIQSLIPGVPKAGLAGNSNAKTAEVNPFSVKNISCTPDGAYTLVALEPQEVTGEVGTRLLVFDDKGKLLSQTELPGFTAVALQRNQSRSSFILIAHELFADGKPSTRKPATANILLRRDGAIAGFFTKEDGSMLSTRVTVSDDDAVAVSDTGLAFTLP